MLGAQRTGLDLVVLAAPERAANATLAVVPETVTIPLLGRHFKRGHVKLLDRFADYPVLIGSGLTVHADVQRFLKGVLKNFKGPFVIDGDALRILSLEKQPAKLWKSKTVVLTPNRQEYERLVDEAGTHPAKSIAAVATAWQATILCKGPTDTISDGRVVREVPGGSPYLAKAGTGDVLAGVVATLLARGVKPIEAALLGAKLLKEASLKAERERGAGLLASDLPKYLDIRKATHKITPSHV